MSKTAGESQDPALGARVLPQVASMGLGSPAPTRPLPAGSWCRPVPGVGTILWLHPGGRWLVPTKRSWRGCSVGSARPAREACVGPSPVCLKPRPPACLFFLLLFPSPSAVWLGLGWGSPDRHLQNTVTDQSRGRGSRCGQVSAQPFPCTFPPRACVSGGEPEKEGGWKFLRRPPVSRVQPLLSKSFTH